MLIKNEVRREKKSEIDGEKNRVMEWEKSRERDREIEIETYDEMKWNKIILSAYKKQRQK